MARAVEVAGAAVTRSGLAGARIEMDGRGAVAGAAPALASLADLARAAGRHARTTRGRVAPKRPRHFTSSGA